MYMCECINENCCVIKINASRNITLYSVLFQLTSAMKKHKNNNELKYVIW